MADLTGSTFADIFPKLLQDPGDGTIQKSDGTAGATGKADLSGGNAFSGVQDFTGRIDADAGISFDGVNVLSNFVDPAQWTPTDLSGAGLSLTNNFAEYFEFGNIVYIAFNVTYPTTSDTNIIRIGGIPNIHSGAGWLGSAKSSNATNVITVQTGSNTGQLLIFDIGGSLVTNDEVSGANLQASIFYEKG